MNNGNDSGQVTRNHSMNQANGMLLPYSHDDSGMGVQYGFDTGGFDQQIAWNTGINDEDCANLLQWLLDEPAAQTAIPDLL